jgi:divalent metal cation (Fe/Co/Zn/Cd) transporter
MSYLVFCTFDLKNASNKDYENAYADLELIGLKKVAVASGGTKYVIPTTATMGQFNGTSASSICTEIRDRIEKAFKARGFKSEIFVIVGGDWAWVPGTT